MMMVVVVVMNIFRFSTAAMARQTRLNITLYLHCLYCKTKADYIYYAVRTESLRETDVNNSL
jgi:hypothetical protein